MKRIQLGGVIAKIDPTSRNKVMSKLTGTARYSGTKWRSVHTNVS
ncbi:hypothetical protein [Paenibacillus sp. N3.4]|nr:hypothetical protein [Paenibacillus sp. N3.4]